MTYLRDLMLLQTPAGVEEVDSPERWRQRREQIDVTFAQLLGEGPGAAPPPLDARIEGEADAGAYLRYRVSYAVDEGERVPAYLLVPKGLSGPTAAVYCPHQTTSVGKDQPAGLG